MANDNYLYTVTLDRTLDKTDAIHWLKEFTSVSDETVASAAACFNANNPVKIVTVGDFPDDMMVFTIRTDGFSVSFTTNRVHARQIYDHYDRYAMQMSADRNTVRGDLYKNGDKQPPSEPPLIGEVRDWLAHGILTLSIQDDKPVLKYGPTVVYTGNP